MLRLILQTINYLTLYAYETVFFLLFFNKLIKDCVKIIFFYLETVQGFLFDFSISYYLYTEVRKAVVKCLNEKAKDDSATELIEKEILPGFSVAELLKPRHPVQPKTEIFATSNNKHIHEEQLWVHSYFTATRLSTLKKSFRSMLNIF